MLVRHFSLMYYDKMAVMLKYKRCRVQTLNNIRWQI